jgi:hypothetical protein
MIIRLAVMVVKPSVAQMSGLPDPFLNASE